MKKNKIAMYLKYAIGEIFLVVIGILLAFSLNNWNAERLSQDQNDTLLTKLSKELDLNIERAGSLNSFISRKSIYTDSIYNILTEGTALDHLDYLTGKSIFLR